MKVSKVGQIRLSNAGHRVYGGTLRDETLIELCPTIRANVHAPQPDTSSRVRGASLLRLRARVLRKETS